MYSTSIPNLINQSLIAIEMNSGPIVAANLLRQTVLRRVPPTCSIASSLVMLRPDLMFKHSREYSSTMFKTNQLRPSTVEIVRSPTSSASCMNRAELHGKHSSYCLCKLFASFSWHFQPCSFPETVHSFVIDAFAIPTEQHRDPTITIPWSLANQLKNLLCQPLIVILRPPEYRWLDRG